MSQTLKIAFKKKKSGSVHYCGMKNSTKSILKREKTEFYNFISRCESTSKKETIILAL